MITRLLTCEVVYADWSHSLMKISSFNSPTPKTTKMLKISLCDLTCKEQLKLQIEVAQKLSFYGPIEYDERKSFKIYLDFFLHIFHQVLDVIFLY